eukprot:comp21657_c0_seq1/m.47978 comp21657_c0_seq1/g.47978  ORF comp21657_c0_seq1/g.47978 comp21657_c0_seq1/m.47978 type:complete len:373 (+) comp21657_c0_seq1:627-1745(+)
MHVEHVGVGSLAQEQLERGKGMRNGSKMERGLLLGIDLVHLCALMQQLGHALCVALGGRKMQRVLVAIVERSDGCAVTEENIDNVRESKSGRKMHCRGLVEGDGVDVAHFFRKHLDHFGLAILHRKMECGESHVVLVVQCGGLQRDEQLDTGHRADHCGMMQCTTARFVNDIDGSAVSKEELGKIRGLGVLGGNVQRGVALQILEIHIGGVLAEHLHTCDLATRHGLVQGGHSALVLEIGRDAVLEQHGKPGSVSALHGNKERLAIALLLGEIGHMHQVASFGLGHLCIRGRIAEQLGALVKGLGQRNEIRGAVRVVLNRALRTILEQQLGQIARTCFGGKMQRRGTVVVLRVRRRAILEQDLRAAERARGH